MEIIRSHGELAPDESSPFLSMAPSADSTPTAGEGALWWHGSRVWSTTIWGTFWKVVKLRISMFIPMLSWSGCCSGCRLDHVMDHSIWGPRPKDTKDTSQRQTGENDDQASIFWGSPFLDQTHVVNPLVIQTELMFGSYSPWFCGVLLGFAKRNIKFLATQFCAVLVW